MFSWHRVTVLADWARFNMVYRVVGVMSLTKNYRGKVTKLGNLQFREYSDGVSFSCGYFKTENAYTFNISPPDYLKTAKKAISELSKISGMNYCIMAKHPQDAVWREL